MSKKTVRTLQLIALTLFALALLVSIASIFFQGPIKRILTNSDEIMLTRSIPWRSIIKSASHLILALLCLLIVTRKHSRGALMAAGIIVPILFVLFDTILLPIFNYVPPYFVQSGGGNIQYDYASFAALESFLGVILPLFSAPAISLLFISIGGLFCTLPPKNPASDQTEW